MVKNSLHVGVKQTQLPSLSLPNSNHDTEDLVNEFRLRSWNRTRSEAFAVRNPNYCHFPALMHTQRARQAPGSPLQG